MVAISNKYQFVFLKTRKTAGTTIERMLLPYCTELGSHELLTDIEGRYEDGLDRGPAPKGWRSHISAVRVRRRLGAERWDSYFRFTAVRNPFDREISRFFFNKRNSDLQYKNFDEIRRLFRRFVTEPYGADDEEIIKIENQVVVDNAVRYESMLSDLEKISSDLGFSIDSERIPRLKTGMRLFSDHDVADFYDEKSADAVRKRLEWVFNFFGYSEDPREHAQYVD